jgi:O-antigen/teichoic acid export membrane protein
MNYILKLIEKYSSQILSLVLSVIFARLLGPDKYGIIAFSIIFISFFELFFYHGVNFGFLQTKTLRKNDFSSLIIFNFIMGLILFCLAHLLFWSLNAINLLRDFSGSFIFLSFKIILISLITSQVTFLSKKKFFLVQTYSTILSSLISGVFSLILFRYLNEYSLVFFYVLNSSILFLFYAIRIGKFKLVFNKKFIMKLIISSRFIFFTSAIDTLFKYLREFIIGLFYPPSFLAIYHKGTQIPEVLVSNTLNSVSSVSFISLTRSEMTTSKQLQLSRLLIRNLTFIVFPITLGLFSTSDFIVNLLLGTDWISSIKVIQYSSIALLTWPIQVIFHNFLKSSGNTKMFFKIQIINKIFFLVSIIFVILFSFDGFLYSIVINEFMVLLYISMVIHFKFKYTLFMQIKDYLPNLLISVAMVLVVLVLKKFLFLYTFFNLLILVTSGVFSYFFVSYVSKNHSFQYFINFFNKGLL